MGEPDIEPLFVRTFIKKVYTLAKIKEDTEQRMRIQEGIDARYQTLKQDAHVLLQSFLTMLFATLHVPIYVTTKLLNVLSYSSLLLIFPCVALSFYATLNVMMLSCGPSENVYHQQMMKWSGFDIVCRNLFSVGDINLLVEARAALFNTLFNRTDTCVCVNHPIIRFYK